MASRRNHRLLVPALLLGVSGQAMSLLAQEKPAPAPSAPGTPTPNPGPAPGVSRAAAGAATRASPTGSPPADQSGARASEGSCAASARRRDAAAGRARGAGAALEDCVQLRGRALRAGDGLHGPPDGAAGHQGSAAPGCAGDVHQRVHLHPRRGDRRPEPHAVHARPAGAARRELPSRDQDRGDEAVRAGGAGEGAGWRGIVADRDRGGDAAERGGRPARRAAQAPDDEGGGDHPAADAERAGDRGTRRRSASGCAP